MQINGKWYSETELEAYVVTLEHKVATLEDKHLGECRQISEYDHELRQAKRLLKAAVEDLNNIGSCKTCIKFEGVCRGCRTDYKWVHADEALALIGGESDD